VKLFNLEFYKKALYFRGRRRVLTEADYLMELDLEPDMGSVPSLFFAVDDLYLSELFAGSNSCITKNLDLLSVIKHRFNDINLHGFYIPRPDNWMNHSSFDRISRSHDSIKDIENFFTTLSLHGLTHRSVNYPTYRGAWEFCDLSISESKERIERAEKLWPFAKDPYSFKFPAWALPSLNMDATAIITMLKEVNFDRAFLSSRTNGLNYYSWKSSHCHISQTNDFYIYPQNLSINDSLSFSKKVVDKIIEKGGCISMQLHFSRNTNLFSDGLSIETVDKTSALLEYIFEKMHGNLEII